MKLNFSPAQRRLYWNGRNEEELIQRVGRLPSTRRSTLRVYKYKKIEYVHDLVKADMRAWLHQLSTDNLRYLLTNYGGATQTDSESFSRKPLVELIIKECVACEEVENAWQRFHRNKAGLCSELKGLGIRYRPRESVLAMVNRLVYGRGEEQVAAARQDLEQQSDQAPDAARQPIVSASTIQTPLTTTPSRRGDPSASTLPTPAPTPTPTHHLTAIEGLAQPTSARAPASASTPIVPIVPAPAAEA